MPRDAIGRHGVADKRDQTGSPLQSDVSSRETNLAITSHSPSRTRRRPRSATTRTWRWPGLSTDPSPPRRRPRAATTNEFVSMPFEAIDEEGLKREPFWKAHGYKKGGSSMDECAFICLSTSNHNNHLYPCLYKFSCRAHLRTNQQEYLTSKTYVLWMSSMDE